MTATKQALERAICQWDKRQHNHHAGAIALLRLDEVLAEVAAGKPLRQAIVDGFNDRLRDRLLKAIGEPIATDAEIGRTDARSYRMAMGSRS